MSETRTSAELIDAEIPTTTPDNVKHVKKTVNRRDFLIRAGEAAAGFALATGVGFSESGKVEAQERKVRLPIFINTEKYDSDGGITHQQVLDFLTRSLGNDQALVIYPVRDPKKVGVEVKFTCLYGNDHESRPVIPNAVRRAGGEAMETVIQDTANKASRGGELPSILAQAGAQVGRTATRENISREITDGDQPMTITLETSPAFYANMQAENQRITQEYLRAANQNKATINVVMKIKTSRGEVSGNKNVTVEALTINGGKYELKSGITIGKNLRQDQIKSALQSWLAQEIFSDPDKNPVAKEAQTQLNNFLENIKKASTTFQNIPRPNSPKK